MAETNGSERTEKATDKRRRDARKKGQVATSRELPSVLILMTAMGFFYFGGSWMFWTLSGIFTDIYQNLNAIKLENITDISSFSVAVFKKIFLVLIPLFLPIVIAGIVGNVSQIGLEFHTESMKPKLSKLNPLSGLKKLVSLKALVELVKSILKILLVGTIAYMVVKGYIKEFPSLVHQGVGEILLFIGQVAFRICLYVCLALIVLAVIDFVYQRWQHEENLKMTKQEVKDERKQAEGDPQVKSRIRGMQREMAYRRMMESVPEADVVITNPTHLAIALKFDADDMIAPQVLAKGADHIAQRIKEIAKENDIPIVEDKPLARTLYKIVEIGDFIPAELYRAVAEVLAYVYRLKGLYRNG